MILSEYIKPEEEYIKNALDYISNEELYFPLLNDYKMKSIEENVMKIFDSIINLYFSNLENLEENIISELFDIFKEYLIVLDDKNYEKYYNNYCNENLVKLYIICYIKIYLKYLIDFICDNRNPLEGKEKEIIREICKDTPISNTIKIYFILLLYRKKQSLDLLKEKIFEQIGNFINDLKNELTEENYNNILNNLRIPKEDKYIFNEYFTYIEYPSFDNFTTKFLSSKENKEKYPLLNQYIKNEDGPKKLKYLNEYNDFVNLMINYYSGKISRNEANKGERSLNIEEIFKDEKFKKIFNKFKSIWNESLSDDMKKFNDEITKSDKFI